MLVKICEDLPHPGLLQRWVQTLEVDCASARLAEILANQQFLSQGAEELLNAT